MMKDLVKYDRNRLTTEEEQLLSSKSQGVVGAANCTSLLWTVDEAQPGQRFFELRHCTEREKCFVRIAAPNFELMSSS